MRQILAAAAVVALIALGSLVAVLVRGGEEGDLVGTEESISKAESEQTPLETEQFSIPGPISKAELGQKLKEEGFGPYDISTLPDDEVISFAYIHWDGSRWALRIDHHRPTQRRDQN